jgi:hypothetical protein
MKHSPLHRYAEMSLAEAPGAWAARRYHHGRTWQEISDELAALINCPVSRETVRKWGQPHLRHSEVTR